VRSTIAVGGAGLACALLLSFGQARAAGDEAYLSVVNGAAGPLTLIVDGARIGELPGLSRIVRPLAVGGHGLAIIAAGRTTSVWDELSLDGASLDSRGRPYWCYLAGRVGGAMRLTQVDRGGCTDLINAGADESAAARISGRP
jgi:hypothetical protein